MKKEIFKTISKRTKNDTDNSGRMNIGDHAEGNGPNESMDVDHQAGGTRPSVSTDHQAGGTRPSGSTDHQAGGTRPSGSMDVDHQAGGTRPSGSMDVDHQAGGTGVVQTIDGPTTELDILSLVPNIYSSEHNVKIKADTIQGKITVIRRMY